jgi:DNA-directed RNA polymerase subunit RPC12/RpoP
MADYVCSACGKEFTTGWSNEEASAEFVARHGRRPDSLLDNIVCDDCHKMITVWIGTQEMTRHQLLQWLGQEEGSLYGECKGPLLDELKHLGFVFIDDPPPGRDHDYALVRLTPLGFDELRLAAEKGYIDPSHRGI